MPYRQKIVDAAVAELRHQNDVEYLDQMGSIIEIRGLVRMSRVIEAILDAALDTSNELLINEIAGNLATGDTDWRTAKLAAEDAITAARGILREIMDPLP